MYLLPALARLARPIHLLMVALTYTLGAGIGRYLGGSSRPDVLLLGLLGTLLAQTSMGLLAAVFRPAAQSLAENESGERRRIIRNAALYTSIGALSALGLITFVLQRSGALSTSALLSLALSLVVILLFAVPPTRAMERGYGELLLAIQIAYLTPSIGFLLQMGNYHRLLTGAIIALTLLLLASFLALEFPSYAEDLRQERPNLLIRLGWENAIRIHHLLLAAAYLLLGFPILLGFSIELFVPAFLTIPFSILQVFLLRGIARGARPLWNLLSANAVAIFGLTTYFLALGFWLR